MDGNTLHAMILAAHNPELAKQDGHVYQIWEDGEVTMQKSGALLGQRNLHQVAPPFLPSVPLAFFPAEMNNGKHASIYANRDDCIKIRAAMAEWFGVPDRFADCI